MIQPRQHPPGGFLSRQLLTVVVFLVLIVAPLFLLYREFSRKPGAATGLKFEVFTYQGWTNSWRIANPGAEVIVVPAVGRVMQFRFRGQDGPFWENPALHGAAPDPMSEDWGNFGGDKTWPSPQSHWSAWTPRSWPPPPAFDSMAVDAARIGDSLVLRSPVDPYFGIRTEREIRLSATRPQMTVVTTYEKAADVKEVPPDAATNSVGIWIITQLNDPVAVFVPVPRTGRFPAGFDVQSKDVPPSLTNVGGLLRLTRSTNVSYKIGNDAESLVWVGEKAVLRVDSPRVEGAVYPDNGCSAEVYTNPDPLSYVELEMLGPVTHLKPGDRVSQTNTYTLYPRRDPDPGAEARNVLGL